MKNSLPIIEMVGYGEEKPVFTGFFNPRRRRLAPALPKAWREGYAKGLGVRGRAQIDIFWQDGKATRAVLFIHSFAAHSVRIRPLEGQQVVQITENGKSTPFEVNDDGTITLKVAKGWKVYNLIVR